MQKLTDLLDEFIKKRILVVGEISTINNQNTGNVAAASAALVSLYAASLGAIVSLVGTMGSDEAGNKIMKALENKNVAVEGIIIDPLKRTLDWQKIRHKDKSTSLNFITEQQVINSVLKQAINMRAILYICQNPANFSQKVYDELRKISQGLRIPLAIFSCLPFPARPSRKLNDLFIANSNGLKLSKKLCSEVGSKEVLILSAAAEINLINKESMQHCKSQKEVRPYQFEAAVATIATLQLACQKYPIGLPELVKKISFDNDRLTICGNSLKVE